MTRTHPDVLEVRLESPTTTELDFSVPEDLRYLIGHFPSFPVVPGIVQIKWAIDFAAHYLRLDNRARSMESIKFRQLMQPGDLVTLSLRWDPERGKLHFDYRSARGNHSSGRVELCRP